MNFGTAFNNRAWAKGCRAITSDVMVEIDFDGSLVYPDVSVVCGNPEYVPGRNDIIRNPNIIIEEISPSTADYDRGEEPAKEQVMGRFHKYIQMESLREYIIVEQAFAKIDVIPLDANGHWLINSYQSLSDEALIPSLQINLPLSEIYRDVTFA